MINTIFPLPSQTAPQASVIFNPVAIPMAAATTWINNEQALRLALGG